MKSISIKHASRYLSVVMIALGCSSHAEDLTSIYQMALENDHEFKSALAGSKATAENKNLNRSGLLPQVSLEASWGETATDRSGLTVTDPPPDLMIEGPYEVPVNSTTDTTSSGYTVTLAQPLFNLSAWHNYKAGKAQQDIADAQLRTAEQALIIRVAQAYFDTLEAADNLETSLAEEEAFKHQLEQSRQRFEVGLSAITEVHESQASYDSSVAQRLTSEGNLGIAFEALEVLTGQTYTSLAPFREEFEATPPVPADRQEWVNRALENNAALAEQSGVAETFDQLAKSARADHLPTLTLSGSYSDQNDDSFTTVFDNSDLDTQSEYIGVTLNVPIFSGGATSASRRIAKQEAIQARQNYLKAKRDIVQAARSNHLSVLTSVATVKALKQAIVSNQSALEATQAGYSVGTRDLVDVLNAQRGLYQAKRNYHDALYTYIINSLSLKQTAGMLTVEDLTQLNAWLDASQLVRKSSVTF